MSENQSNANPTNDNAASTTISAPPTTPIAAVVTPTSSDTSIPSSAPPASKLKAPTNFGGSATSLSSTTSAGAVSKIGRLCTHAAPKAGPPPRDTKSMSRESDDNLSSINSAYTDMYQETVKRFTRSSLSPELDRYSSTPSRLSTKSPSQKSDPDRRFSFDLYVEATGRRRSSDHGAVLTADTEQFIIGQRVWVGGARPGQIAYIGETHFAPGDWAGIVLDELNGKNDGCVAGKRYFQCEPKRGIFSRLTRLTLAPLPGAIPPSSPLSKYTPDRSHTVSPTASIQSSALRSPGGKNGLTVGDRVIVSSGFGSRPGILRYLGETQFASGNWCGIELDEATGKNDGSVDGIRYFECPVKYGVFVPIAKVSLSPSTKKSRLSRTGSRESLTSIGTMNSVATTNTSRLRMSAQRKPSSIKPVNSTPKNQFSMQDLLREKQNHIEQLMIERDLDREDAQNQALQFQKNISELKSRITDLERKLSDERKKTEDLQFSIDEATFCGDELNAQTQVYKEKIHDLEIKITKLASGAQSLQTPSDIDSSAAIAAATEAANAQAVELISKLSIQASEHESQIANVQEEEKRLQDQIVYLKSENEALQRELLAKDESLEKFSLSESGIENLRKELALLKEESERERLQLNTVNEQKLAEKNAELKQLTEELSTLRSNLKTIESESTNVEDECEILRSECKTRDEQLRLLTEQVTKLTFELSIQSAENAAFADQLSIKQLNADENKTALEKNISKITKLNEEISALQGSRTALEADLQRAIAELKKFEQLQKKYEEILNGMEKLKRHQNDTQTENENLNTELKNMLSLKNAMQAANEELQRLLRDKTEAHQANSAELRETQEKASGLEKQVTNLNLEMQKSFTNKNAEIEKLNAEILKLQEKTKALEGESSTIVQRISERNNNLEAQLMELQQSLQTNEAQLETQRQTAAKQEAALSEKSAELTKSANALESATNLLQKLKEEQEVTQNKVRELEMQLKEHEVKNAQQELQLGALNRQHETLNAKCVAYTANNETLQQELLAVRTSAADMQENIKKLSGELAVKQKAYDELKHTNNTDQHKLENQIEELQQKLDNSSKASEELKENLRKSKEEIAKQSELITAMEEKSVKQELLISDAARQQEHLQTKFIALTEQNVSLQNDLTSFRSTSTDFNAELLKLSQDVAAKQKAYEELLDKSGNERGVLESQLQASQQRIDALCSQVEALTQELKNTTEESFKRFEQLKQAEEIRGKLELDVGDATRKLEALTKKTESLEQQNTSLQNDLSALRAASTDSNSEVLKLTEEIAKRQKAQQELSDQTNVEHLKLESQIQELSQRNAAAQAELETMRNELKATLDRSAKQAVEFESLKTELNTKAQKQQESALAERKTLCDSFEQQLQSAEKTKITLDEAISSLQQQIKLLQDELLKSQLDFKAKEHELSKQLEMVLQEKEQLRTVLQQLQTTGNSTQQEKVELLQRLELLSTQLMQKEAELLAVKSEAEQQKLAQANASIESAKLEHQLKTLEQNLQLTTSELSYQTEISQGDKTKMNELKFMLETLQTSNANMSATNAELSEALQLLESEKCETRNNFELFEIEADRNVAHLHEVRNQLEQKLSSTELVLQSKTSSLTEVQMSVEKLTAELQTSHSSLEAVQTRALEDATKLTELEVAKGELVETLANKDMQIQELTVTLSSNVAKCTEQEEEIKKLREELEKLEAALPSADEIQKHDDLEFQLAEYKQVVDEMDDAMSNSKVSDLQNRLQQLENERQSALQAEKAGAVKYLNLQRKLEQFESEKKREIVALQGRISDLQTISKLKQNGAGDPSSTGVDDNDSTAQINFLNSIIADMQKKNDMLKAKIDALEALPTDFTKPHAFDLLAKRKPAPRVFCDICDEFDKHETEDCPVQASDDRDYSPPPMLAEKNNNDPNKKKERKLPEPRKYCKSCEVFGHETGECDDECY